MNIMNIIILLNMIKYYDINILRDENDLSVQFWKLL